MPPLPYIAILNRLSPIGPVGLYIQYLNFEWTVRLNENREFPARWSILVETSNHPLQSMALRAPASEVVIFLLA